MSFKLVAQVMDIKVGSPLKKLILIKLADQANDEGICWPSYKSISSACEISKRSVIDHIKSLELQGFLKIERRYNHDAGKNFSNRYHLTLNKGSENAALVQMTAKGSENAALGSENAAPEPINEPIKLQPTKDKDSVIENKMKSKPKVKATSKAFSAQSFQTPLFIDKEMWVAFHDMRDAKKKPAMEYTCKLLVNKLTKFNQQGLNANKLLEKSIINSWIDVFEPPANKLTITNTQNKGQKNGHKSSDHFDLLQAKIDAKYDKQPDQQDIRTVS